MRGDNLGSPIFATYAIGGDTSSRKRDGASWPLGGNLALPMLAILGTASVVAIVSVAFEGETIAVSGRAAGDSSGEASGPAGPALASAPREPAGAPVAVAARDPGAVAPRELPYLSVLQANPGESAVRPAPRIETRPEVRSEPRSEPQAEIPVTRAFAAPLPRVVSPAEIAGPAAEALPATPQVAAPGVPPGVPLGDSLDPPAALAVEADASAGSGLQADSRPAILAVPESELAAAAPVLVVPETPLAAAVPGLPAGDPGAEAVMLAEPSPAPDSTPAAESAPASQISEHIARIGERYASPQASPPPPAASSVSPASSAGVGETAVTVTVDGAAAPAVIVQENELVAIRLGELVSLLEDKLDQPLYVWLKSSSAAAKFVTAETLAAAGIATRYDPQRRQLVLSTTGE